MVAFVAAAQQSAAYSEADRAVIVKVRVLRRWHPARIAGLLGLNPSTVHWVLVRYKPAWLARLDRTTGRVVRHYERAALGEAAVHLAAGPRSAAGTDDAVSATVDLGHPAPMLIYSTANAHRIEGKAWFCTHSPVLSVVRLGRARTGAITLASSEPHETMRAADRDREEVADNLRLAYEQGRLSTDEYDDRMRRTWIAGIYGELDRITSDLPHPSSWRDSAPESSNEMTVRPSGQKRDGMRDAVRAWFIVSFLNFGVWFVLGLNQGFEDLHPWWVWVAGG